MSIKTQRTVSITTCLVVVYVTLTQLAVPLAIIFFALLTCIAGLLCMVYTILKDTSNLSGKTFNDHFYEDADQVT